MVSVPKISVTVIFTKENGKMTFVMVKGNILTVMAILTLALISSAINTVRAPIPILMATNTEASGPTTNSTVREK